MGNTHVPFIFLEEKQISRSDYLKYGIDEKAVLVLESIPLRDVEDSHSILETLLHLVSSHVADSHPDNPEAARTNCHNDVK